MLITSDEDLANKIRKVQSLGYIGLSSKKSKIDKNKLLNPNYERHYCLGWNYRISELCSAVALGQLENIRTLVSRRIHVAKLFQKKSRLYNNWFVPQKIPNNCKHSYWTWAVKLETNKISWEEFVNKFKYFGGDNVYAAWKLSYQEPSFKNLRFLGREKLISKKNLKNYSKKKLCPNAEYIQPRILQFKTNYWKIKDMYKQANVLEKTLKFFGRQQSG
jgi:perosamine synthetase